MGRPRDGQARSLQVGWSGVSPLRRWHVNFDLNFKNESWFQAEGAPWEGWVGNVCGRCGWLEEVSPET